jgi:ABC-type sugar transport system substrate-binding protein
VLNHQSKTQFRLEDRTSKIKSMKASSSFPTRRSLIGLLGGIAIAANPDLRGVFSSNLIMAQGAGQAMAENKVPDKIKLVGFDSDDKLFKLLADGDIAALVVQDTFRMGCDGIKTALAASKGEGRFSGTAIRLKSGRKTTPLG